MILRHYLITSEVLGTEGSLCILRDFSGLRFVRETVVTTQEPHVRTLGGSEIVGYMFGSRGITRVFYICQDRPADGQGEFTPDDYHGVPCNPATLQPGRFSAPPLEFEVSAEVVERERKIHAAESKHWTPKIPAFQPPPPKKSWLRSLLS